MNFNYAAKLAALFIFFYAVLYVLSNLVDIGLTKWSIDPAHGLVNAMFWLMPFVGFFFVFVALDYIDRYLEIKFANTVYFPLAFIIACFISFLAVLSFYIGNTAQLSSQPTQICIVKDIFCVSPYGTPEQLAGPGVAVIDFWERLRASAFLLFVFSGLFGWLSKIAMDRAAK